MNPQQQTTYTDLVRAAGPSVGPATRLALASAVLKGQTSDADILAAVALGEKSEPRYAELTAAHRERQQREAEIERVHKLGGNRAVQEHLRGTNDEAGTTAGDDPEAAGDPAIAAARTKLRGILDGTLKADGSPRNEKTTNANRLG